MYILALETLLAKNSDKCNFWTKKWRIYWPITGILKYPVAQYPSGLPLFNKDRLFS